MTTNNPNPDVLQSHDHKKLTAEEIAKAVARHNKTNKGGPRTSPGQNPKAEQKKAGKH